VQSARAARRFPALFTALAEGRLHLAGVVMLAPHLTPENSEELIAAATHRTKAEIELLLAQHFPRPDVPTVLRALEPAPMVAVPSLLGAPAPASSPPQVVAKHESEHAPGHVVAANAPARQVPLSPGRYALQVTIGQGAHEKLEYARALLGHAVAPGDIASVLERGLDALIEKLEKTKFAATSRTCPRGHKSAAHGSRHIPADVRRAVWLRDGGRCTFENASGKRCEACKDLEFDHVVPYARGGEATVANLRLRCRAHNQHAANRTFGKGFMDGKRHAARGKARARAEAPVAAPAPRVQRSRPARDPAENARLRAAAEELIPGLRALNARADEAHASLDRHAVRPARCEP
jgi:5-methylcytosine-specific restriction endonuclease McrA